MYINHEACGVYTTVMGEVCRPVRQVQQSLSFLIDDALFAAQSDLWIFPSLGKSVSKCIREALFTDCAMRLQKTRRATWLFRRL